MWAVLREPSHRYYFNDRNRKSEAFTDSESVVLSGVKNRCRGWGIVLMFSQVAAYMGWNLLYESV